MSRLTARRNEKLKDEIVQIFSRYGLKIDILVNKKVVNFLDITLDLNTGLYIPYMKENNTILYVNKKSNHPPSTLKNIPESRVGPNSEYGPNTEYRIIRFLKILRIPNTELFGF